MTFYGLTRYRSLYDIDALQRTELTWEGVVKELEEHVRTGDKHRVGGYGPHVLKDPLRPCDKHADGRTRHVAHRCDDCVQAVTLAVFDADVGTLTDLETCDGLLAAQGYARIWYSSYSYTPLQTRPSFRLVLPLDAPVDRTRWKAWRKGFIHQFKVPADPNKCAGLSHFYFLPSCPPDVAPVFDHTPGKPVVTASVSPFHDTTTRTWVDVDLEFDLPEEPTDTVDLGPLRETLRRRASSLARGDARAKQKADWLTHCVKGEALSGHGHRRDATRDVAGMLAWALPGTSLGVLTALMLPSVRAMQADGSSVTDKDVERNLVSAMKAKARADAENAAINNIVGRGAQKARDNIPQYTR